jgi:hypothetical protein
MRRLTALALWLVMVAAAPVRADDMDSQQQTEGYGKLFGYVCGVIAGGLLLVGGVHVVKGFLAESARGKKTGALVEEVLDKSPRKERALYLGEKVPDWKVANRLAATRAALKVLAGADDLFGRKHLVGVAGEAFQAVKAAVEERSLKVIERRVTPECLDELQIEVRGLKKKGLRRVFGAVEVTEVQIVHFEAPPNKDQHTFTALVSARSRDYAEDEKTRKVRRGNKKTYGYQEFWRFRRGKSRWLVERIRPAGDMDVVLKAKNIMTRADLDEFAKGAEHEHLKEFMVR